MTTAKSLNPDPTSPASGPEPMAGWGWHAAWAASVLGGLLAISLGAPDLGWAAATAMIVGAAPAAAALLPIWRRTPADEATVLALWAIGASLACILTGGVTGPLAVWCLTPLAATARAPSVRRLGQAAVLGLLAAALAALVQVAGVAPAAPPEALSLWMALVALGTTGGALACAAYASITRSRSLAPSGVAAPAPAPSVEPVLDLTSVGSWIQDSPHLLLAIAEDGTVTASGGASPPGGPGPAVGASLYGAAAMGSRPELMAAVRRAVDEGAAQADFIPAQDPERLWAIALARTAVGGVVAVVRDVTDDRTREAGLEAARAHAEALNIGKSRFLANMSHELRTPLNAVMGFSDVMKARLFGDLSPRYAEYAELIHESGRHLLDLINDVLDMSKIEAERYQLSLESFDARDAVSGALRLVRVQFDTAGVSLRGVLPSEPLPVEADRRALKQIVLNLVSNALKFTPKGGGVTVSVAQVDDALELTVADTGVGIAPEDLERLGRPYEQAGDMTQRAHGTGLGLSLVRAFAELHGGSMAIESRLGEGTSVQVRLPVAHSSADPVVSKGAQIIPFGR